MSRIGMQPIVVPGDVNVQIGTTQAEIKGPKGALQVPFTSAHAGRARRRIPFCRGARSRRPASQIYLGSYACFIGECCSGRYGWL